MCIDNFELWVNVNDRPPNEEEKHYLCYTKRGYQCICLWTDDIFGLRDVYINSDKKFGGEWGWSVFDKPQYDEITHWMELPKPPCTINREDKYYYDNS